MNKLSPDGNSTFRIVAKGANATGVYTEKGFVVGKGAIAKKEVVPTASDLSKIRNKLIDDGILEEFEDQLRFTRDHTFDSPSGAAAAVLGRTANGWIEWKSSDGKTLNDVVRSPSVGGLDPDKRKAIIAKHEEMERNGGIIPEAQLVALYEKFRLKFGPQVLQSIDGEALLNLMHDHSSKDSLAYWLEFKNDDEFPTGRFGSIAGGSALKFGIFRRKETGNWQTADDSHKPHEISVKEAIRIAEKHREQILKGIALLEQLPESTRDEVYAKLQKDMDKQAPDVSRLAWGHKYFSLLFPNKLDDFHSPEWQRFHLLKLLQEPPKGEGRYLCAGRFIAASNDVAMPIVTFDMVLNAVHGGKHHYWRIGTTNDETGKSYWEMMKQRNVVAIGWPKLGNLGWVEETKESRQKLKELMNKHYASNPQAEGKWCAEITKFVAKINEGDIVWAADGATILGIGRIDGEYEFEPGFDFPHQRRVKWLSVGEWKMPTHEGLRSTVRQIRNYDENILETERRIRASEAIPPPGSTPKDGVSFRFSDVVGRIQSILQRKGQVILYGPPGTGKTYWAEKAANDIAAVAVFARTFTECSEQERSKIVGDGQQTGFVRWCCFHPAYGYEDFLEGYRPHTVDGHVTFELRNGVFKRLCHDAVSDPTSNYFLVIDEINRGDIPRIFGELLTILEKDKRGKKVVLPVSQEVFFVPKNVFVIGTMNTADRSISLLDAALRRRFGFVELMPDGSLFRDLKIEGVPLQIWFEQLNSRIRQHVGGDARNLQIGHSYLMQGVSPLKDFASLKRAIREDIIPLLEEYCYENYSTLGTILGLDLVDVEGQRIRNELFDDGREQDLVQRLLAPISDLLASTGALTTDESEDEVEADENSDEETE